MKCPRCHSDLQKAPSFAGGYCPTWLECSNPLCRTYVHTYKPQPHQFAVHVDNHRTIGNFGGYGTGKTTTSREDVIKHCLITPSANVVIGANISRQYEQTIKRELENDLPAAFISGYSVQKQTMDWVNGARILWTPFDDPDKLRSMNLTMAVILEASEVKGEAFRQLGTRLRNTAACTFLLDEKGQPILHLAKNGQWVPTIDHDWRKMIAESNPDSGWIRSEILLRSDKIYQYDAYYEYLQDETQIVRTMSSHVAATSVNAHLPPDFEPELRRKNPVWWIKRYLEGSFQYSEGLVYPGGLTESNVVDDFPIPRNWKRIVAFDYGISDLAAFVFAAIDEKRGIVYIYKEMVARDRNVEQLAKMYHMGIADIPSGGLYTSPIIDPKSGPKRGTNLRTLSDEFLDYDISFQPGVINVDARIYRLNTYFDAGKVKLFRDATRHLQGELRDYKFPERTLSVSRQNLDKPIDKDNHTINALEWIVMELPQDPRHLLAGVYDRGNQMLSREQAEESAPTMWQFADDESPERKGSLWW